MEGTTNTILKRITVTSITVRKIPFPGIVSGVTGQALPDVSKEYSALILKGLEVREVFWTLED